MQESKQVATLVSAAKNEEYDKIHQLLQKPQQPKLLSAFWSPKTKIKEDKKRTQAKHAEEIVTAFQLILEKYQTTLEKNGNEGQEERYRSLIQIFYHLCRYYPLALNKKNLDNFLLPNPKYLHITANSKLNPMRVILETIQQYYKTQKSVPMEWLNAIEQLAMHGWCQQFQKEKKLKNHRYEFSYDTQFQINNAYYRGRNKQHIPYIQQTLVRLLPESIVLLVADYYYEYEEIRTFEAFDVSIGLTKLREYAKNHNLDAFSNEVLESISSGNLKKMKSKWKSASTSALSEEQAIILSYYAMIVVHLSKISSFKIQGPNPPKSEVMQQLAFMTQGILICSGHFKVISDSLIESMPVLPPKAWHNHRYENPLILLLEQLKVKQFDSEHAEQAKRLLCAYSKVGYTLEVVDLSDLLLIPIYGREYNLAYNEGEKLRGCLNSLNKI